MAYFRSLVFTAVLAGLIAGLVMTVLQSVATVPLITAAEVYETAEPAADAHAAQHEHAETWAPADGVERMMYTALTNIVSAIGFALVLTSVSEVFGGARTWRRGIAWGIAAFLVFLLAPSLGLPPELPGMPAADLAPRQFWWTATALATAGALALLVWRSSLLSVGPALALATLPHLIGAPEPVDHSSAVPIDLWRQFIIAVGVTNFFFWCVLGVAVAFFTARFTDDAKQVHAI